MSDLPTATGFVDAPGLEEPLAAFCADLAAADIELHSLQVRQHGELLTELFWDPWDATARPLLYSVSKSFTSTAAGFGVAEGRFGLDDRVLDLLPEVAPSEVDPRTRELTLHHLLSMSTGHTEDTLAAGFAAVGRGIDLATGVLSVPPQAEVGSRHVYNNGASYLVGRIVQRAYGQRLLDVLRPRLFDPLGIDEVFWKTDLAGHDQGFSGIQLSTEAMGRFGQLLLDDGVWNGEQVLPTGWVSLASGRHIPTVAPGAEPLGGDWEKGYGYQFWRSEHGFRADGAFGQFILVLPEVDAVVVTTSCTENMQGILDAVWTRLLPALIDECDLGVEPALALAVPESDGSRQSATFVRRPDQQLAPGAETGVAARLAGVEIPALPSVRGLTVEPTEGGHLLRFDCGEDQPEVLAAEGRWQQTELAGGRLRVRAAGGWEAGIFRAELAFIASPHRAVLEATDGVLDLRWALAPLSPSDWSDFEQ